MRWSEANPGNRWHPVMTVRATVVGTQWARNGQFAGLRRKAYEADSIPRSSELSALST